jgi:hypothetical protein
MVNRPGFAGPGVAGRIGKLYRRSLPRPASFGNNACPAIPAVWNLHHQLRGQCAARREKI